MTPISKEYLVKLNHNHVWHPFTQMQDWVTGDPLIIEKGDGNWLIDIEGKRYIDGVSSLWANIHGHNRTELNEALVQQMNDISHTTMLGLANVPATLLAERLVKIAPGKLNKVFYSDSGATAVEIGLKMAYQYWQQKADPVPSKKRFIKLKEAYHGDTIGSVSVGGIDLFHKIFSPLLFDTFSIPTPFYYHSHFQTEQECMNHSLNELRKTLERHHSEIAGLFIEPYVQGAAGMIVFPKGYMKAVQQICRDYQILLIADEVATGFGRTGKMFACEEDQLTPDIMTVAKGITGGYLPLAATLTTDDIYQAFLGEYKELKAFFHGHTYTGNPLAARVALASLDIFENEQVIDNCQEKISRFSQHLKEMVQIDHVGDIRQKGLMMGIELVKDKSTRQSFDFAQRVGYKVCMEARKHELIIRPLGDVIVLMPPLSITADETDLMMASVRKSILAITEAK